jgi:periplasmic protein TonB
MRRIGIIRYQVFLLTCLLAMSAAKADGQREQFTPPHSGPPIETFPQPPDDHYAPIPADGYPPQAIRQRHEGTTYVLATLDPHGKVTEVMVYQSSGYRELDRVAMKTVQARLFHPCIPKTQFHQQCTVTVPVVFHLPKP